MLWHLPLRATAFVALALTLGAGVASAADKPFDEPPVPLKTVPPEHPLELKRAGISGMVSLMITVDENGAVQSATVLKSTNPEFERSAVDAVSRWKFKPAKKDGKPVAVKVAIPVKFTIE